MQQLRVSKIKRNKCDSTLLITKYWYETKNIRASGSYNVYNFMEIYIYIYMLFVLWSCHNCLSRDYDIVLPLLIIACILWTKGMKAQSESFLQLSFVDLSAVPASLSKFRCSILVSRKSEVNTVHLADSTVLCLYFRPSDINHHADAETTTNICIYIIYRRKDHESVLVVRRFHNWV